MVVDLVVPCFNEESRWSPEYWERMLQLPEVRWTFVNDGSTDGTLERLSKTADRGNARVLDLPRNSGKAEAVRQGMLDVLRGDQETDAVGYMDADGAFDLQDVADIVESFRLRALDSGAFDSVWSSRVALGGRNIERHESRHYIGRVVATVVSQGEESIPYDTQSGLKLFAPSQALNAALAEPFQTRWLFELELLSRWRVLTGSPMQIWEEPLNYWRDVPGSKIRGKEMVRIAQEIVTIKRVQRKSRR